MEIMGFFDIFKKKKPAQVDITSLLNQSDVTEHQTKKSVSKPRRLLPKFLRPFVRTSGLKEKMSYRSIMVAIEKQYPKALFNKLDEKCRLRAIEYALKTDINGRIIEKPLNERQALRKDITSLLDDVQRKHKVGIGNGHCRYLKNLNLCVPCNREKSPLVQKHLDRHNEDMTLSLEHANDDWNLLVRRLKMSKIHNNYRNSKFDVEGLIKTALKSECICHIKIQHEDTTITTKVFPNALQPSLTLGKVCADALQPRPEYVPLCNGNPYTNSGQVNKTVEALTEKNKEKSEPNLTKMVQEELTQLKKEYWCEEEKKKEEIVNKQRAKTEARRLFEEWKGAHK